MTEFSWTRVLSKGLLSISLISLALFTLVSFRDGFDSDSATAGMIALEQWRTGTLFVPGWYYSQDFWPMFVFNTVTLFYPVVQDAYIATQIQVLIQTIVIFLLSSHLLKKVLEQNASRLFLSIAMSGVSLYWSGFFWGQGQYGNVLMYSLLGCCLICTLLETNSKPRDVFWSAVLFLTNLYINTTSVRYLALFEIPAVTSLLCIVLCNEEKRKRAVMIILTLGLSAVFGLLGFKWLSSHYTFVAGINDSGFKSYHSAISENFPLLVEGYLNLISNPVTGHKFASFSGALFFYRFVFSLMFFTAPFVLAWPRLLEYLRSGYFFQVYMTVFFLTLSAISFFSVFFLTSTLNDVSASRYMMLSVYFGIFVSAIMFSKIDYKPKTFLFALSAIPIVLYNGYFLNAPLIEGFLTKFRAEERGTKSDLVNFLLNHNLKKGYASYWNADVLTVLSNYKLLVYHLKPNELEPWYFMSSKYQYLPSNVEKSFLLIENKEIPVYKMEKISEKFGSPIEVLNFNNYTIFVYSSDIAVRMAFPN